ncbi:peroxidase TAP [Amylocarpus encephaloides]|uniref:Peroxidase TAP n=1 Tax=Amylocarpus encephaloides TaxID=45428 RepID=A0A9P8CA66_9HELO|nr:peroxidase TAP [Amylocarpus encephaloides]
MSAPFDLCNVQGDILTGLPKKVETYWFIQIKDCEVDDFRQRLSHIVPLITSCAQTDVDRSKCAQHKKKGELLTLSGVNIAFSKKGLCKIGITEPLSNDIESETQVHKDPFEHGMRETASKLNDRTEGDSNTWFPEFKQDIHCLVFITGDCQHSVDHTFASIKHIFGHTITEIKTVTGTVRPGDQEAHEHFGYLDGVSQPAIKGVHDDPLPGGKGQKEPLDQGVILLKRDGDEQKESRPDWTLDGSFLAFRYLSQLVPEFQDFIDSNNPCGAEDDFLGAQLVGRWKSGAPIVLAPHSDNPKLGKDRDANNNFDYDIHSQKICPFVAHTRKTNPRADLDGPTKNRILRRGITFGPEVTKEEKKNKCTDPANDRGLLFKCYQSNIKNGFEFIQNSWANNPTFPFLKFNPGPPTSVDPKPGFGNGEGEGPGFDPIIGQAVDGGERLIDIKGGNGHRGKIGLPTEWVISKGGEYFFSPSISTLRDVFAVRGHGDL